MSENVSLFPEVSGRSHETVIDRVLGIYALGKEYVRNIAVTHWNTLSPADRLRIQVDSTDMATRNLAISESCATDLLVLDYADRTYSTAA